MNMVNGVYLRDQCARPSELSVALLRMSPPLRSVQRCQGGDKARRSASRQVDEVILAMWSAQAWPDVARQAPIGVV